MFSEPTLIYKTVPVQYRSGDRDFRLIFGVSVGIALSKINRTVVLSFVGEPVLRINLDNLEEKIIFYLYVSLREEIKKAAVQLVVEQYRREGIFFITPQYN